VNPELAETLASNKAVLDSVDASQAKEIFDAIDEGALTNDIAAEIVAAVQDAPKEIRETFEDTVDLFEGVFDDYEMVDQEISVGDRRTVIAVSVIGIASSAIAAAGAMPSRSTPSSSSSLSSSQREGISRKEEQEAEPEIEIEGEVKDSNLSKYKYVNGEKVLDWKNIFKKLYRGFFNMGFTLAGGVVLFFTVSGTLRVVVAVSFAAATVMAMLMYLSDPDN
jgi:hypothetical protein